jgi:hypothetical protein
VQKLENSRPKPERMEETFEGGQGPPRAVAPLERERETREAHINYMAGGNAIID